MKKSKLIGILTEKPSARANFKKALGGDSGRFNNENFVLCNALGHLYALKDPEEQVGKDLSKKYKNWDLSNLPWNYQDFQWKYSKSSFGLKYLKEIKETLEKCDEICIGTDIDPSGEGMLLASEIILQLNLNKGRKIYRMEFIDESSKSLQKAFIEKREIVDLEKDLEYQKAFFRSRWDYLSMQFTRISTNLSPVKGVIRQGRLKSIMVKLIGEAEENLKNYKEIPFFQNKFKDENGVIYTNPKEEKFNEEKLAPNHYQPSEVVLEKKEIKQSVPPKLLDLAKLSSILAPKGISAKETLDTYQKMYQDGIVSYPRTEDKTITMEQFNELLPIIDKIANVVNIDKNLLTYRKPRPSHVKNQGAHGANRPGKNVPNSLTDLKKYGRAGEIIYKTLALSCLAMFAENYEYEHQTGFVKDYPKFKGSVNVPKKLGWKQIFDFDFEDEEENKLGIGKNAQPFIFKGSPPKPPTPTMNWLMKQLDKNNVGSGSTKASTYSEISAPDKGSFKRQLLNDDKGKASLSTLGYISYQLLKGTKIGSIETTEKLQETMKLIGEGKIDLIEKELENISNLVKLDLEMMSANAKEVKLPEYKQIEKEKTIDDKGEEVKFKNEWNGHKFTEDELEKLKNGEEVIISDAKFINKKGKTYKVKGKLDWQVYKKRKYYGFKVLEFIND